MENPTCNMCGGNKNTIIQDDVQGKKTNKVECCDCNLIFFSPRPTWEEVKQTIYSNVKVLMDEANNYFEKGVMLGDVADPEAHKKALVNWYTVIFEQIKNVYGRNPNSILEIGCSVGWFLETCARNGIDRNELYGLDINKYAAKVANDKMGLPNVAYGDFKETDYNRKFDWVVMFDYIEHTYYPSEDVEKAYNLLNDDGVFVMKTFLEELDPKSTMLCPPCHAYHFYGDVLYKLLRKKGFKVLSWNITNEQAMMICKKRKNDEA